MIKRFVPVLAGLLVAGLGARPSQAADIITLESSEKPVSGEVTEVSKTEVTIETGLGSNKTAEKVPANDIAQIEWDGAPAALRLALNAESKGRLDAALQQFNELRQGDVENAFLETDLDFFIARTKTKQALADSSQLEAAIAAVKSFLAENPNSFRYYEALAHLGDLYLAAEDYANAKSTFEELAAAPWTDYQMAARVANARLMLAQENIAEAQREFDAVAGMPAQSPTELARKYEAMLGKASCLQKRDNHAEAVETLADVAAQAPADQAGLQAEIYLRQGDSYRALNQTKSAILAYLHVDVLFSQEPAAHAEALYWLSQLWSAVGHENRAAEAAAKLESSYPNSEWTKKLAVAGG